jgi:hypothetical protein
MSGPGPREEDIVAVLETILGRPALVSGRELDLLPERDPEAFEVLRTIDGMSGRIRRSEEGGIL